MPAALPLETGVLLGAAADGFLVGHRRRLADDGKVVAVAQPVDRDVHMHVALAPKHHLAHLGVLLELQRWVLVDQLGDGARQFDVVAALLGMDGETEHRLRPLGPRQRLSLARRGQHRTGGDLLHPAEPDDRAGLRGLELFLLRADEAEDAGDAGAVQRVAFGDRAAPHPRQRELAGMRQVIGLDDLRQRLALGRNAEPAGGFGGIRRFMP